MKKTLLLKKLLQTHQTEFIMEAHNGLSAKIVEEAVLKAYGQVDYPYLHHWEFGITTKQAGLRCWMYVNS